VKYNPRELKGNVNVSSASPVREFLLLLVGIIGICLLVYTVLGFAVDIIVSRIPVTVEDKLADLFSSMYETGEKSEAAERLQHMLDSLVYHVPQEGMPAGSALGFKVHLVPHSHVNAMAFPGRHIVVFTALLKETSSENELAFVLAHELGHYANRDHLRGLGRSLVLMAASAALLGADSSATNIIMNSLLKVEMKFSQKQETAADLWALDLLNRKYGHVSGATDFFANRAQKENKGRIRYYFATHPYPDNRVKRLEDRIEEKGYIIKDKTALDEVFDNLDPNNAFK
jgi:predicted Zn-dependent protease